MNPEKVVIGNAELWLGDCREVLPQLPRDAAIISDPPYGIGYVHSGSGSGLTQKRNVKPIIGDDAPFDPAHLLAFPVVLLFGANHFAQRLPAGGSWLVWDKSEGVGPADNFADAEFAWASAPKIKRNVFRHLWKGLLASRVGEDAGLVGQGPWRRLHPSMKPVALMSWCIGLLGAPPMVVDPYMGSGATGVAAMRAGSRFVGVEMDREYFDIACERIERAQRQERLFA